MKSCVIISGGRLDVQFASEFIKKEQPDILITADKGLAFCEETGILPTQIVGDFDTLGEALLPKYEALGVPIRKYNPVKDYTDTEIAVRLAMELGADKINILGASEGNRLDHLFGNVMTMMAPAQADIQCFMVDAHNRVRILKKPLEIQELLFRSQASRHLRDGKALQMTLTDFPNLPANEELNCITITMRMNFLILKIKIC